MGITSPNRLAREKSPYLLQHANNPVDWFPWGEEAFAKARAENKPIFLSIGYSTCHWCHVMAHESFENADVAAILNASFVSIKVDREERPDVDRVYMTYVQAMTGHGGWPLSAWLTPDLKPFYGGTYFPPDERYGRPSFANLLRSIARAWEIEREKLVSEGDRVIDALRQHGAEKTSAASAMPDLTEAAGDAFEKCFQYYYEAFDSGEGGFGSAPKFPRASNLNFLFRVAAIQGVDTEAGAEAIKMATTTLQKMAEGGIHDHVGGGFHRYSVDEAWFVPHFEKMLYDQAQIAVNYLDAFQMTRRHVFLWIANDIFQYVRRDLTSPDGAFFSAEDADSIIEHGKPEHAEGAFYVWTKAEIEAALAVSSGALPTGSLADLMNYHFGVTAEGNVPQQLDPHREFAGKNILKQRHGLSDTARKFGLEVTAASDRLVEALAILKRVRDKRPRPHLDDKIITGWNALMISALARAAQIGFAYEDEAAHIQLDGSTSPAGAVEHLASAVRAAEFIQRELYDSSSGVLYRSFRQGRALVAAFAEDYAYLIQALLDLYEADFEIRWLEWAEKLQATMDRMFWDEKDGGYFQAAEGDASIVLRLKDDYDAAEPTAGSVAAMNLLRLAPVSRDGEALTQRAVRTLASLQSQWARTPQALPQALCALEYAMMPRRQVVIAGDPGSEDFRALWRETQRSQGPRCAIFAADGAAGQTWLASRAPWLGEMKKQEGRATAYLCEHYSCREPVTTPSALRTQLES
ncbi:MAG TPA: thioredoxin domain-containing protein [Opitutaceae bacterium]|nr:thioredoxin domain-containing protein [Opitutaceae bacterium]